MKFYKFKTIIFQKNMLVYNLSFTATSDDYHAVSVGVAVPSICP